MASESDAPIPARYLIGIDLGTTNSAVAYVDTKERKWVVRNFAVPQLTAPGEVETRETLPSFYYAAAGGEFGAGTLKLPWDRGEAEAGKQDGGAATNSPGSDPAFAVGFFAREKGATAPGRLIASAKSWLSHSGVDRTAALLPWHGAADVPKLSPVAVGAAYLAHLRRAWDFQYPAEPMARQDVALTVPASFDEVARELTVRAAREAGLHRVVLVEEPQAAFYAWVYAQGKLWDSRVKAGQKILVCDVGGGTSDFTLIRVKPAGDGKVNFHRIAVGEHLILGGDNLDLALAHHIEKKLAPDGKLDAKQFGALLRASRRVKETLLGVDPPDEYTVNVFGGGSKLIGSALQCQVTREEVQTLLMEGFLPRVALNARPAARRSGFQEFGLPYAPDAAITKYVAAFLTAHREAGIEADVADAAEENGTGPISSNLVASDTKLAEENGTGPISSKLVASDTKLDLSRFPPAGDARAGNADRPKAPDAARPDLVLFNGGLFESPALRDRLIEVLSSWFPRSDTKKPWEPKVLKNARLDLAVARGAAYYGMVRRGKGVRISGGLAHTYYVGAESADGAALAVCLIPAGVEEGQAIALPGRRFDLLIRQPAEFPLYYSSTRTTDLPGSTTPIDPEQMSALPPIRTVLQSGRKAEADTVPVRLHAKLTEVGTLDIWCAEISGDRQWRLQFDVRAATQSDAEKHEGAAETEGVVEEQVVIACRDAIREAFRGPNATTAIGGAAAAGKTSGAGGATHSGAGMSGASRASIAGASGAASSSGGAASSSGGAASSSGGAASSPSTAAASSPVNPAGIMKRLEQLSNLPRGNWPTSFMRGLWETLMECEPARKLSAEHEARWLSLAGFCLRPGYGLAVDDWRVGQMWRLFSGGLRFPKNELNRAEWWILWRRVAGGLTPGQQTTLADPLIADLRALARKAGHVRPRLAEFQFGTHESAEVWRLLGALELLKPETKIDLGNIAIDRLCGEKSGERSREKASVVRDACLFALGRLGARILVYGPLNALAPVASAENWADRLMRENVKDERAMFALVQLCRLSGDRYRDVSDAVRSAAIAWLTSRAAPPQYVELIREVRELGEQEQRSVFGETLPRGLKIR